MRVSALYRVTFALLLSATLLLHTASANIFGDFVSGVGGALGKVGQLIGSPFGGFLKGATDPAMEGAADRFKEVADHAADRIDQSLAKENVAIENIATTAIAQINTDAEARLNQVEKIANGVLDHSADILDQAITQVDALLDKDIEKLQNLEGDAFNQVEGVIHDEVPFAAGEIAHELVYTSVAVIFLIVLVGYVGIRLVRHYKAKPAHVRFFPWLRSELGPLPEELLVVGIPMALISVFLLAGYEAYHFTSQQQLISRLETAGSILEQAGDYKAGADFRRRAFALSGSNQRDYFYRRDLWLADFTQAHKVDAIALLHRLGSLETVYGSKGTVADFETGDGELLAASIYLRARYLGQFDAPAIQDYRQRFLSSGDSKKVPFLGKLVLVAAFISTVDDGQTKVSQRLKAAEPILEQLGQMYPRYAVGQLLAAQDISAELDQQQRGVAQTTPDKNLSDQAVEKVNSATGEDANLVAVYRLANLQLPKDVAQAIADPAKAQEAQSGLNAVVEGTLLPLARGIYGSEGLSRAVVLRRVSDAVRRTRDESALDTAISAARDGLKSNADPAGEFAKCLDVAEKAERLSLLLVAESWADQAEKFQTSAVAAQDLKRLTDLAKKLKESRLSSRVFQL
jgi:hypothetical protein